MKEYEIFTATFSKLIKAVDKDSAKITFEQATAMQICFWAVCMAGVVW